jgi:hypothetical protein
MKLEKRIRALEAQLVTDPVILHFSDGTTRELRGPGDFLLRLFNGICSGADLSPEHTAKLELVRQSVDAEEPGGTHMVELLRAFLAAASAEGELDGRSVPDVWNPVRLP